VTELGVSTALKRAREARGLKQQAIGDICFLSYKTVSAIETGRRRLPMDVAPKVAAALDDPEMYAALQAQATGGVASPWLNGEKVDLHRASVRAKALEELDEAMSAIERARAVINARSRDDLDEAALREIMESLEEVLEAQTACQMYIGIIAQQYNISLLALYQRHHQELRAKGYIAKE
jgi:DNA-binding XRE family transcriptional regulator